MTDKKIFTKMAAEKQPEIVIPSPELDLELEKSDQPEKQGDEEKFIPEQPSVPPAEQTSLPNKKPHKPRPAIPLPAKDEVIIKIEKIMEAGLNDSFQRLSPVAKQEFKLKGEETASQVNELLKSTHVKAKKILHLILDWLRMLPGINHFFLEQEAKIKTDKIIALKNKL